MPNDPLGRAKVKAISHIIASGTQPVQNLRVLRKHGMEHKVEWGQWAINHVRMSMRRACVRAHVQPCVCVRACGELGSMGLL